MGECLVQFDHVSKRFRRGASHDSLGEVVAAGLKRLAGRRVIGSENNKEHNKLFWALRDVSFEAIAGQAFGIIGPNGAGKSTALKLLAGILRADDGHVHVNGRLVALIEIGAGFHPDLTGRENIFLNGAILGMGRREIQTKLDAIVAFAGLDAFIDTPVKRYSSGMYARLGFAIAANVEPDILLVDEVLSVGDAMFRLRCLERMRELVTGGTALVFVTHNLDQMQTICSSALVLDHGRSTFIGPAGDAVAHYFQAMSRSFTTHKPDLPVDSLAVGDRPDVQLRSLRFLDLQGEELVWTHPDKPIRIEIVLQVHRAIPRMVVELNMRLLSHENLLSINSGRDERSFAVSAGRHTINLHLPTLPLSGGHYFWNVRVWDADRSTTELDTPFKFPLVIDDRGRSNGSLCIEHRWKENSECRMSNSELRITESV